MSLRILVSLGILTVFASTVFASPTVPPVPEPRVGLFVSQDEIVRARQRAETLPWAIAQKARILKAADAWVARDDAWIRSILPAPGSKFAYGVAGCPKCGKSWKSFGKNTASFDRPLTLVCPHCHTVFDLKDPKGPYADTGNGVKVNGQTYWLRGIWNAFVTGSMWSAWDPDQTALVNLCDAYALTGDAKYAHKAIVIMDALATLSPTTNGPRDFTDDPSVDMGRMQLLTSIFFRGQMFLTRTLDMVGRSPELEEPSPTKPGKTIWQNIRAGLYDDYLFVPYDMHNAKLSTLHNHEADSYRGLLLAGLMFGEADYVRWGARGFQAFLDNDIDRDGLYYETSLSYTGFTRTVYIDMAELLARYDPSHYPASTHMPARSELPEGGDFFNNGRLARLTLDQPARVSLVGREPTYGNNHWDTEVWKKPGRPLDRTSLEQAERFAMYATDPAIKRHAEEVAAEIRPGVSDPTGAGNWSSWALYHEPDAATRPAAGGSGEDVPERSDLFGNTGLTLLRSGAGANRRGAALRFGPNLPHAHNDQAALMLYAQGRALSGDIGYGIFGNHVHLGWATQAIAHHLVVVNQNESWLSKQFRYEPGGTVERFYDGPGVTFVEGSMAGIFPPEDGVKEDRRTVMQIDLSPDAVYWVDLYDVDGGHVHDYSMHTPPLGPNGTFTLDGVSPEPVPGVWTLAALDPKWRDASFNAEGRSWGERLTVGGMIAKIPGVTDEVPEKPWWFAPPGNGYGFLYGVKSEKTFAPWSATWAWTAKDDAWGLRLTMLPEEEQQVITAWGPTLSGQDKMPFVIVRHGQPDGKAPVRTRYAAVLEAYGAAPAVTHTEAVRQDGRIVGLKVTAGDREDVILDARKGTVSAPGAPKLDAGLGVVRRKSGALTEIVLCGGPALAADGFALELSTPAYRGRIVDVDDAHGAFRLSPALPEAAAESALVVTNPAYGRGTTYRVGEAKADGTVVPLLSDTRLARGTVENPTADGFTSATPLVLANVHEQDLHVLDGKRVVSGGQTGHILTVNGFTGVKEKGLTVKPGDEYAIYDVQTGDAVTMDGTASLSMNADGTWTVRANGPCHVSFPWPVEREVNGAWRPVSGRTATVDQANPATFRKAK